jgi:glycosyltransferase involved in cell wall biosynthesis
MRIVMIAPFGIRPKGTLIARMLPLAQALARRGHQVAIVAPPVQNPEDADTRAVYGAVTVAHTRAPRLLGPLAVAEQSLSLLGLALAERPDLIHLFKPKGYGGLAALAARALRPRLPLVVDTDDWEGWGGWNDLLPYPASAKALFAWQERDLPRRADAVTVVSHTLQSLAWSFGVPPGKVFYLPNGSDQIENAELKIEKAVPPNSQFSILNSQFPKLLLYTRFWEIDLPELVAALVAIHQGRPDARLVVVGRGEGGEEHRLLALAERAGIGAMIDYRGWLQPAQIPAALAEADLALAPLQDTLINRARGLAKLLELMGAGLPIVASAVGQASEYLEHDRSGLLCAPGDPAAMAAAALRLVNDASLRARIAAGAHAAAARFSWDTLAATAEAAYGAATRR